MICVAAGDVYSAFGEVHLEVLTQALRKVGVCYDVMLALLKEKIEFVVKPRLGKLSVLTCFIREP